MEKRPVAGLGLFEVAREYAHQRGIVEYDGAAQPTLAQEDVQMLIVQHGVNPAPPEKAKRTYARFAVSSW